jgi:hypothetical protein
MRLLIAHDPTVSPQVLSFSSAAIFDAATHALSTAASDSPEKLSMCSYSPTGIEMVVRPAPPTRLTHTSLKASLFADSEPFGGAAAGVAGGRVGFAAARALAGAFVRL